MAALTAFPTAPPEGSVRDMLDQRADEAPDAVSHILPDAGARYTWRQLRDEARAFASRIAGLGVAPGESVALMTPNGPSALLALFGALYGGFRATPVNLVAGADAVGYALAHSKSRVVLVDDAKRDLLADAQALHPASPLVLRIDGTGAVDWPEGSEPAMSTATVGATDAALLMYTSGTTGRPKGVVHTQASLLAGGWTTAIAHQLEPGDRALCVLPLYHINGLCVTVMAPLVSGGSVSIPARFSASQFWATAEETEATWFSVVPTIISHLLQGKATPSPGTLARMRFGRSASAPLSPDVHAAFEKRFGIPIIETMGLTETAAQILSNPLPPGARKIGSPGVAVGNEVIIGDKQQRELPRGQEGEVLVRGPNVLAGYLDDPKATAEAITPDGWLRTGDLGKMDSDGYVFITGRLKELIIKGGENIAPREIDDALYAHPAVVEAAAFGKPCDRYGQTVEAGVVLSGKADIGEADLLAFCADRLGPFKCPDHIHILDDLPKGASGKIMRRKVAEMILGP